MANQKKHKKKKKIQTKTSSFYDSFFKKTDFSVEEYLLQLKEKGLVLTKEEILKQYEDNTSIEDFVLSVGAIYRETYQKLLLKLIPESFDTHILCDPYYIYADVISLSNQEVPVQEEMEELYKLMSRIEKMYKQQKKDITYFHRVYNFDMTSFLVSCFVRYGSSMPGIEHIQYAEKRAEPLLSIYSGNQSFFADMKAAILCGYAACGNSEIIDKKKKELLNLYPKEPYFVYYSLLHGIASSTHIDLFDKYYEEAMKYMVFSNEEQTFKDQITLLYKAYEEYQRGNNK